MSEILRWLAAVVITSILFIIIGVIVLIIPHILCLGLLVVFSIVILVLCISPIVASVKQYIDEMF